MLPEKKSTHETMTLYLLSLVPFIAGPLLVGFLQSHAATLRALDLAVVIGVGALVLVGVLPHAIAEAGLLAGAGALLGLGLPLLTRGLTHDPRRLGSRAALAVGVLGLALHDVADGMALTEEARQLDQGALLAAAVLLHRLPVVVAVWWMVGARHGKGVAAAVLAVLAGATTLGFFGVGLVSGLLAGNDGWPVFQALVAGALLHVVLDHGFRSRHQQHPRGAS